MAVETRERVCVCVCVRELITTTLYGHGVIECLFFAMPRLQNDLYCVKWDVKL